MKLETHPNSSHATQLQEAQAQANECIDQDHTLVLQNISQSSPGYYYLGLRAPQTTQTQHGPTDIIDGNEDQVSLGNELEDVEPMGPI